MSGTEGREAHLYEADKVRIRNEAKVRTAAEQPDFAEREFKKWRADGERAFAKKVVWEEPDSFVNAWAKVAWLAEGRMLAMGRELAKAQARIGRQRKANRELIGKCRELEQENERQRLELGAWQEAVKHVRSAYPQSVFRPGPPYQTKDAESADWARRVVSNVEEHQREILKASLDVGEDV